MTEQAADTEACAAGSERGEVASWLILMAGLAVAATLAAGGLGAVIGTLSNRVSENAGAEAGAVSPGEPGDTSDSGDTGNPSEPGDPSDPSDPGDPGVGTAASAADQATLASDVYTRNGGTIPEGLSRVDPDNIPEELRDMGVTRDMLVDEEIGYDAAIYQDEDGNYVVAFRGTDGSDPDQAAIDHQNANLPQQFGFRAPQYDRAVQLVETMAAGVPDGELSITGHSLGGGLASVAALANGVPATVYDPAGIHPDTLERYGADPARANELITGYQVDGEILSNDFVPVELPFIGWTRQTMQPTIGNIQTLPAVDVNGQVLPPLVDPGPAPGRFSDERAAWNQAMAAYEAEATRRHGMDFVHRGLEAAAANGTANGQ